MCLAKQVVAERSSQVVCWRTTGIPQCDLPSRWDGLRRSPRTPFGKQAEVDLFCAGLQHLQYGGSPPHSLPAAPCQERSTGVPDLPSMALYLCLVAREDYRSSLLQKEAYTVPA